MIIPAVAWDDLEDTEQRFLLVLAGLLLRHREHETRVIQIVTDGPDRCPRVTVVHHEVALERGGWQNLPVVPSRYGRAPYGAGELVR